MGKEKERLKEKDILALFNRVYNNKMIQDEKINDAKDLKQYCEFVFGDGGKNPDPSALHQFNNLIVETADEVARPMVTDVIGLLANITTQQRGDIVQYQLPQKRKAHFVWSANGVGVDLIRVEGKHTETAVPRTFSTGFQYDPNELVRDSVDSFNTLINDLANAKVRLYLKEIAKVITAAKASQKIPAANVLEGTNITLADYNKLASNLSRYGGRPVFIADPLFINYIAMQYTSDTTYKNVLTDTYRDQLRDFNIASIGMTDAINLVNPFVDDTNTVTELPVDTGYMLAGEGRLKPFRVVEYGGMRQMTQTDFETERVMMKVFQDACVVLVFGSTLGYLKDDGIH